MITQAGSALLAIAQFKSTDGRTWCRIKSPAVGGRNVLADLTVLPDGRLLAIGYEAVKRKKNDTILPRAWAASEPECKPRVKADAKNDEAAMDMEASRVGSSDGKEDGEG